MPFVLQQMEIKKLLPEEKPLEVFPLQESSQKKLDLCSSGENEIDNILFYLFPITTY